MRALIQRVRRGSVTIGGQIKGEINAGLVVLLGVHNDDTAAESELLASKVANLRVFTDADGKFNLSALDVKAEMLVVSQFTLYADTRRGRRPGFTDAARPETAIPLYERFVAQLRALGFTVATGEFGADMLVEIHNDGPVTIWLDTDEWKR
jgi:D-tyrosyl-tRNA(Tyr) deacylase